MDDKEIAKEILIACIEHGGVKRTSSSETAIDAVCEAYKEILKAVKEG